MIEWFWLFISFILWAVLHSLMAALPFKGWVRQQVGQRAYSGFYRLFYNLLAIISFLPILYVLWQMIPMTILWRIPFPLSLFFFLLQGVGLAGLLISLLQTDALAFIGLSQAIRYLQGVPDPDPPVAFVSSGTYGLVRHPLYFFSLLFLWFSPLMTVSSLVFNLLATLYFYLGALHEERRLEREFGNDYHQYRQRVPAFIPFLKAFQTQ